MLSYNFVHEAVASGAFRFSHIAGDINLAGVLSKHWSHGKVWHLLKPTLFWMGDTMIWTYGLIRRIIGGDKETTKSM
jgi:hypothetical protein